MRGRGRSLVKWRRSIGYNDEKQLVCEGRVSQRSVQMQEAAVQRRVTITATRLSNASSVLR